MATVPQTIMEATSTSGPKSLTKAELLAMLDKYPDDAEIRIIINEQDIRKAKTLQTIDAMPFEFELSKLCLESDNGLKINAWVHISRLATVENKPNNKAKSEYNSENEKLINHNVIGWVKWFNPEKGIGFLQCDEILQDIFVYYKHIADDETKILIQDSEVSFSLYLTDRGPRAKNVKVIHIPDATLSSATNMLLHSETEHE